MNKNKFVFFIVLVLIISSIMVVDASVLTGAYVGDNFCAEQSVQKVLRLVGYLVYIAKVAVPLIIIIMGTIDLFNGVVGKDISDLKKSFKSLLLRIVLGIFIFFIPNFVEAAFNLFYNTTGESSTNACVTCVLDPGNC